MADRTKSLLLSHPEVKHLLEESRWYSGKGKAIQQISFLARRKVYEVEETEKAFLALILVQFQDGSYSIYFFPYVLIYALKRPCALAAQLSAGYWFADALQIERFRRYIYETAVHETIKVSGNSINYGSIGEIENYRDSKLLYLDQSNSAFEVNGKYFCKVFRHLDKGINTDVEILRYFSQYAQFKKVPAYIAGFDLDLTSHWEGLEDEEIALANGKQRETSQSATPVVALNHQSYSQHADEFYMYQHLFPYPVMSILHKVDSRCDAWGLFREYADDFFREVLKNGIDACNYSEIQNSINSIIHSQFGIVLFENLKKLAAVTAEMHIALQENPENLVSFRRESLRDNKPLLKQFLRETWEYFKNFSGPWRNATTSLGANSQVINLNRLHAHLKSIIETAPDLSCIRIHADYHLGQLLWTGNDFVVIDFEGEPGTLQENPKAKFPVHKDVAGMLRSFSYSAFDVLVSLYRENPDMVVKFKPLANAWIKAISESFYQHYIGLMKGSGLVYEREKDNRKLLDFFMIQKAIYELAYEHYNRPSWVLIPIYGLEDLLERLSSSDQV